MQLTQRTRFRMLFSLPIPTCTGSEGRHRSLLGLPPSCLTALDYNYVGGQNTSKCLSTNPPGGRNQFQCRSDADQRPNPEDEYRKSELSTRLTHLHGQLSPTLRRTFQLRDVDGLSIRETAQILGVPTGTVKAQSTRARQKLKELMRRTLRLQYRRLPSRLLEFASSTSRN